MITLEDISRRWSARFTTRMTMWRREDTGAIVELEDGSFQIDGTADRGEAGGARFLAQRSPL